MKVDVLIAGAGPAGLAAAIELQKLGVRDVLVVDREGEAGGVPRHCAHTGCGIRDLHQLMTGPAYARHYRQAVRTGRTLTGWQGSELAEGNGAPATLPWQSAAIGPALTSPAGIEDVQARAVLLATGCRERPRSAGLVPDRRPAGVMTTGELQQRVFLHGQRLAGRAVVVGAEHVSFFAMLTLMHAGATVTALVTDQPRHQSFATSFTPLRRRTWRPARAGAACRLPGRPAAGFRQATRDGWPPCGRVQTRSRHGRRAVAMDLPGRSESRQTGTAARAIRAALRFIRRPSRPG